MAGQEARQSGRRGATVGPFLEEMATEVRALEDERRDWRRIPPRMFLPGVDKATLAVYGSRGAIFRERARLRAAGKFIIHPYCPFRHCWLMVTGILTVINIFIIPFGVSFFSDDSLRSIGWITFSVVCDIVFLLDIILNFFTGYMKYNVETTDSSHIKLKYLKTWFVLDLLGLLPIDYILTMTSSAYYHVTFADVTDPQTVQIFKVSRIFSLLRLFRVSRLVRYAHYLEEVQDLTKWGLTGFLKLIYSFVLMVSIWHWTSCFQFLIQKITDFPENSWVRDMHVLNDTIGNQYSSSLFRSLSHMLTVSYGTSALPQGVPELWLVCVSLLTGTALYVSLLSKITAIAFGSYGCKRMYKAKYEECELFMQTRRIPRELQKRILNHLYIRFQGKWFDEEQILKDISESLRQEVMIHNCRHLVTKVPWLRNTNIINGIMKELKFEVFQNKDVIFRKGSIGKKMYMIDKGEVSLEDSGVEKILKDSDFFGEMCLIGDRKRTETARAFTPCRLYSLSLDGFKRVLDQYPSLREDIEKASDKLH